MNIAPRLTDRNVLPVRNRLPCRIVGPVLARNFRVARQNEAADAADAAAWVRSAVLIFRLR